MIFSVLQLRIDCPECGNPTPLNGPLEVGHCDSCQADINIPHDYWKMIIETILEDLHELQEHEGHNSTIMSSFNTNVLYGRLTPCCPKCKTTYPIYETLDRDYTLSCSKCQTQTIIMPAPGWLRKMFPNAQVLYNAVIVEKALAPTIGDARPVVFSCPQCGGALKVDGQDRILTCQYCNVDVYLPDDLWLRLHPVKRMLKWFIGFNS